MRRYLYIVLVLTVMSWNLAEAQEEDSSSMKPSVDQQLIIAADAGDTAKVSRLIGLGADVDAETADRVTSLMYA
jgi:hypothetical protein